MTTEILLNYLFSYDKNGSNNKNNLDFNIDIENELAAVIFDEVHFINDAERGKVWESSFMLLPPSVQLVMLSATIDNPENFASWIETKRFGKDILEENDKIVYLASTTHRIVPLVHYCFLTTNEIIYKKIKDKVIQSEIRNSTNKLLLLKDEKGSFNESTVQTISKMIKYFENKQVYIKRQHVLNNLALHLKTNDMLPAIVFVFSRKHVELCAKEITIPLLEDDSKIPYTIRRECEQIIRKLPNFQEYLELPEYNQVVSLLEKGIGIHHSGLLPILREMVELMISKKYVKMLFATESFAIGLNCAIRSAVFTNLNKYDGNHERYLYPSEYTQAASRCGRRNIDKIGYVIHLNNLFHLPSMIDYKEIMCGKPQELISKFHISYPLILNLIKNGQTNDFHTFSEKSMVQNQLDNSLINQMSIIHDLNVKHETKSKYIHSNLRTPYDVCVKYIKLEQHEKVFVNKKRKEVERELNNLRETYKYIKEDIKTVNEFEILNKTLEIENNTLNHMKGFVKEQTDIITKILFEKKFIQIVEDINDHYCFTKLGVIASNIAEIHPLIISEFIHQNNYFKAFSSKQLVGLFSCFTDIKLPSDKQSTIPNCDDSFLKGKINDLNDSYFQYQKLESQYSIVTGINYVDAILFDIIDLSMKWCECETEQECKYFIQNDLSEKSISIGDFNKALLKIVIITKELMNVCEIICEIDLLHKLSKIEPMILKYVTTNQSLYV